MIILKAVLCAVYCIVYSEDELIIWSLGGGHTLVQLRELPNSTLPKRDTVTRTLTPVFS